MTTFSHLKWVRPGDEFSSVPRILTRDDINQISVVEDHTIVGMIGRDNLLSFINIRTGLGI